MGESHSVMLVRRAIEAYERYLDAQARGEFPTVSTFLEGHSLFRSQFTPETYQMAVQYLTLKSTDVGASHDMKMAEAFKVLAPAPSYKRRLGVHLA